MLYLFHLYTKQIMVNNKYFIFSTVLIKFIKTRNTFVLIAPMLIIVTNGTLHFLTPNKLISNIVMSSN